ncbi:MAG: DUF4293 domain-containing protein [Bacteroidales bacterium]|nr:DUF4293 domain-containing protein [Bacteroidales bacterium]
MLQRIQTVYMLGSVIAILMMLLFPLGTISSTSATFSLSALGISSVTEEFPYDVMRYPLIILLLIMFVLPLFCIFMYNKRKMQLRILIYSAIVDLLFYAYFFMFETSACYDLVSNALHIAEMSEELEIGYRFHLFAMPAVSCFCCIMAFRGVAYDIALLESADRLRPSRK